MKIEWIKLENPVPIESFEKKEGRLLRLQTYRVSYDPDKGNVKRPLDLNTVLIGHINVLGGVCDDCSEHGDVLEYSDSLIPLIS